MAVLCAYLAGLMSAIWFYRFTDFKPHGRALLGAIGLVFAALTFTGWF